MQYISSEKEADNVGEKWKQIKKQDVDDLFAG